MKTVFIALALTFASLVGTPPQSAEAQGYSWQCDTRYYCDYYGCYYRQYCCIQVWNYYTGAYAWRCEWR